MGTLYSDLAVSVLKLTGMAEATEEEAQMELRNRIYYDPARSVKKDVPTREAIELALHRRNGRKYALNLVTKVT
jgi:hypothetical protein